MRFYRFRNFLFFVRFLSVNDKGPGVICSQLHFQLRAGSFVSLEVLAKLLLSIFFFLLVVFIFCIIFLLLMRSGDSKTENRLKQVFI